jgi:hypothetical protein
MKIWGPGVFENSAAMDWLGGIASGLQVADLRPALEADGTFASLDEADAIARAAAYLIAVLANPDHVTADLPQTARLWVARQSHCDIARELRPLAISVAERLRDPGLLALLM